MSAIRLDGRREADRLLRQLSSRLRRSRRPILLATVLVGSRYDSALYVRLKRQAAARVGIATEYHHLPGRVTQATLERRLRSLGRRRGVTGILLQLPLPAHLDADAAVAAIDPAKDVDGFHPANHRIVPPPVAAVLRLIALGRPAPSSFALIAAQPSVFTVRLLRELERRGHAAAVVEPNAPVGTVTRRADILVTALGRGPRLSAAAVKSGAVIVDVGIRKDGKSTVGDVARSAWRRAKAISPVPGGVGPLTIAYVLWNTYTLAKRRA